MMNLDFPRLGTIQQAAEASGIPVYRVRQGPVRAQDARESYQPCGLDGRRRATTAARYPPGGVMTTKIAVQRVAARQTAKGWRKAGKPISTPILSF